MEEQYKIVHFHEYCKTCEYFKENDDSYNETCDECLYEPVNLHSHKPVKWKEKTK